jgi:Flp pilus assembly protein TadG
MEPEVQVPSQAKRGPVKRLLKRFRDTEAGQALVEFTMILPIFLILLFGLVDFGRGFYSWLVLTNAAREGARVAATQGTSASIDQRIHDSFCKNYPSNCSLDPAKVTITKTNVQGLRGSSVVVDLSFDFDYVTPVGDLINLLTGGTLSEPTITARSSMRLE